LRKEERSAVEETRRGEGVGVAMALTNLRFTTWRYCEMMSLDGMFSGAGELASWQVIAGFLFPFAHGFSHERARE
jgi:hypothetical protein